MISKIVSRGAAQRGNRSGEEQQRPPQFPAIYWERRGRDGDRGSRGSRGGAGGGAGSREEAGEEGAGDSNQLPSFRGSPQRSSMPQMEVDVLDKW
jgi:hypothetical protein